MTGFFFENRAFHEMKWKNIEEPDRLHMTIRRMRIACWITKATNTHTQNMQYSLLFHCNNDCTNAQQCYLTRTLPSFLIVNDDFNRRWNKYDITVKQHTTKLLNARCAVHTSNDKGKTSLSTSWRHREEEDVKLHSFLISTLDGGDLE
jgi:hypothetical protein